MSGGQQSIQLTAIKLNHGILDKDFDSIKLSCVIIFICIGGSRSPADYTDFF
jgi:hypothetical protein